MMYYIAWFFEIFIFAFFLSVNKKKNDVVLKYLGWYLLFDILSDAVAILLLNHNNELSAIVVNINMIVKTIVFTIIFFNIIPKKNKKQLKVIFTIIAGLICCLVLIVTVLFSFNSEWNSRIKVLWGAYFVILSCYYLYREFITDNLEEFLVKKEGFWIATGTLIFYSGDSVVISIHQIVIKSSYFFNNMPLHHFFSTILATLTNICLLIAMIVWRKKAP